MSIVLAYPVVLFDLDGTLTDPYEGIARSVSYALERLGAPLPGEEVLRGMIGPPLRDSFAQLLGDMALADEGVRLYRERYAPVGSLENRVYPGIPALLRALRSAGATLCLATSKPLPFAERILDHFGLLGFFDLLGAATLDGRIGTKEQVVATVLERLPPDRGAAVLVGDREHDVFGARAWGLPCIAVAWGYGSLAELRAAEPHAIVETVDALRALLMPDA